MKVDKIKYFGSILMFVVNIGFSYLPFFINKKVSISIVESLTSGVFICIFFLHIMPDAIELFSKYEYPIPSLISLFFFVILFMLEFLTKKNKEVVEGSDDEILLKKDKDNIDLSDFEDYNMINKQKRDNNVNTFILYLMLIFHGFTEAITFGIVEKESSTLALFCGIIGHKPIEVFSVGFKLMNLKISKFKFGLMMFIFCLVPSATVIITTFVKKIISQKIGDFIKLLSTGTFLFVCFHELSEIIRDAKKFNKKEKIIHLISFIIGIVSITLLSLHNDE